jgi:hypothetical protein
MTSCPLCSSPHYSTFQEAPFLRCPTCKLIFKDFSLRLAARDEKERYSLHENDINDPRYVKFLWPVVEQVKNLVPAPARGLDFGSGPSPVLAELLSRENYSVKAYDPFFSPLDLSQLEPFDFIVSTEAAEHFYSPDTEIKRMMALLKPTGILVIRTEFFQESMSLNKWHYVRDPTHVCFYSEATMNWIGQTYKRPIKMISSSLCVIG